MAQRSRPPGFGRSPVVALWQSPGKQAQEIPLERGAHGVLLTARAAPAVKRSFDGRRPRRDGSEFGGARVRQVHGASPDPAARAVRTGASARSVLEPEELTILTSWAEAVADALAFAPHRIDGVLAAAHAGAPWRAEFGVPEPGTSLSRAIDGVGRAARTPPPTGGQPPLAALAHAVGDPRPDASALDRLVHAALRSALEQRQANQVDEGGDLVTSA
jgi:hypothetical protein